MAVVPRPRRTHAMQVLNIYIKHKREVYHSLHGEFFVLFIVTPSLFHLLTRLFWHLLTIISNFISSLLLKGIYYVKEKIRILRINYGDQVELN